MVDPAKSSRRFSLAKTSFFAGALQVLRREGLRPFTPYNFDRILSNGFAQFHPTQQE
jgi:hypothetical protein